MFAWLRRVLGLPENQQNWGPPWSGEAVPWSGESVYDFSQRKWEELPADQQRTIVMFLLRDQYWVQLADEIGPERVVDPRGWYIPHHFGWGMAVRNQLRNCLPDAALPTGNWDDYYIAAVHAALDRWEEEKG